MDNFQGGGDLKFGAWTLTGWVMLKWGVHPWMLCTSDGLLQGSFPRIRRLELENVFLPLPASCSKHMKLSISCLGICCTTGRISGLPVLGRGSNSPSTPGFRRPRTKRTFFHQPNVTRESLPVGSHSPALGTAGAAAAEEEGEMTPEMRSLVIRSVLAVVFSSLIAFRALRRKSLDRSGAVAGFLVMAVHIAAGYRFGALIMVFFFTSSYVTKVGEEVKRRVDADFREGGRRNWVQVMANSVIATSLVLLVGKITNWQDQCLDTRESRIITGLIGGIIGHYACCNGDTWSSELGVLSDAQPRLITTFKKVQRGTNGGITGLGLLAAAAAGGVIGLAFFLLGFLTTKCAGDVVLRQLLVIPVAAASGLCGSMIDSLLGATLQFSGFCSIRKKVVGKPGPSVKRISGMSILDNDGVNFVSVLLTTLLTSIACLYIF